MERPLEFLPKDLRDWAAAKAAEGRFGSSAAFVQDLLERVRARESEREATETDAGIQRGLDSMARGEGRLIDTVLDELHEKHGLRREA